MPTDSNASVRSKITRLGLQIPSFEIPGVPNDVLFERLADVVVRAERAGFDSIWVMDHFLQIPNVGPESEPMFEAYTLLGALAARTTTARLGTLVTGVTYRHPSILAKQVTALDVVSRGRAVLGIGAAWFEREHQALGVPFPPLAERFDRLAEAVRLCRAMFTEEWASFEGRYYRLEDAPNLPRPVQPGGPPILVGGGGERRTLRIVAELADGSNVFGGPTTVAHKLAVLRRHLEDVGRDPAEITTTRLGTLVVDEDAARAKARAEALLARRELPPQLLGEAVTWGTPDEVRRQAEDLLATGLDGLIFNLDSIAIPEHVELAGEALRGV
jgi:F420-dependent oxidoreductase-like protein